MYFSNNAFLKNVKEATTSKLKVKHLLILLARLLFITFLVLTFAQPFWPGNAGDDAAANKLVYLYLDNSLSMESELASGVRSIDQGASVVEEITTQYPRNTQYKLLTNEFNNFSRVPKNNEELSELVTGVELTSVSRTADEVMSKIRSDRQSSDLQEATSADVSTELYIISDFQKSTMGDLSPLEEDTSMQVNLVPIVNSFTNNLYVDSVYLANPFMLADQANELTVSVRNQGKEVANDLIVRLLINDQQVANASLDINPFSSNTLRFPLNFPLEASNRCQLVFEDYPATFDNEFYFTINLGDKISVLEIAQDEGTSNVARVYASEQLFNFQSFSINNLDYSLIEGTDLLVLNEIGNVSEETRRAITPYIQQYLENGGNLIFVIPPTGNIAFLQQITGNQGLVAERVPLPDSVGTPSSTLANPDLANPFFSNMFEGEDANFEMPTALPLINHNLRGEAYLRYRTGDPYLLALRDVATAAKQIFVFTTPLRQEFTSIYRHGIFVPVMYRLASMSKSLEIPLYYSVEQSVVAFKMNSLANSGTEEANQQRIYKLRHENQEVIPLQRVANQRLIMEIPQDVVEAGFYDLVRSPESDSSQRVTLSFNVDQKESQVAPYSLNEISTEIDNSPHVSLYEAEDVETFTAQLQNKNDQQSFWKYALVLALFFLLIEVLLIRFL